MPSCVMRKCYNHTKTTSKSQGTTYHSFPRDALHRQKWTTLVRAQRCEYDWMPSRYSQVCSKHFASSDFYTAAEGKRTMLIKSAVPIIKGESDDDNIADADQPRESQPGVYKEQNLSKAGPSSGVMEPGTDETETDDKYDILGKYVASKVRQLDTEQRTFVERIIKEAIFEGQMGTLNINSQLVVNTETFATAEPHNGEDIKFKVQEIKVEKEDEVKIKVEVDIDRPEYVFYRPSEYDEPMEDSNGSDSTILSTASKTCGGAEKRYSEDRDEPTELHLVDVPNIKVEIITEEHENLLGNLGTDQHSSVTDTVAKCPDNAKRRKLAEQRDIVGVKVEVDTEERWNSQDVHS